MTATEWRSFVTTGARDQRIAACISDDLQPYSFITEGFTAVHITITNAITRASLG